MEHKELLTGTSAAFQALHAAIGDALKARFPDTKAVEEYGMAAWAVPVPTPPAEEDWKGTMPRTDLIVGPTEKKAGITIHVWHPNEPNLLKQNEDWLKEVGFKPMVGCLQWNRKTPLPMAAFERLLDAAKKAM